MATKVELEPALAGVSAQVLAVRQELAEGMREIAAFTMVEREVSVCAGRDAIWAIVRRSGRGGLAIRAAHCPGGPAGERRLRRRSGEVLRIAVTSAIGVQTIAFTHAMAELAGLRICCELTPAVPLLVPFLPRDLYPLGRGDDPLRAQGEVEAAQRGLNSGVIYFHIDEPGFGTVLYFQNLTALNDYFLATRTTPDGAVGGEWPELGYLPPTPAAKRDPAGGPVAGGPGGDHLRCDCGVP